MVVFSWMENAVHSLSKRFIALIVDDSEFDRELYLSLLKGFSDEIEVVIAVSLSDAREKIANADSLDFILLDLMLPDGKGSDLIAEVQKYHHQAAILMLTSESDMATALECMQKGADDYLIKGAFNTQLFHRTIRYALERKRAAYQRQELQLALAHEQQLNAAQKNFIELVAHEFKTPLAIISSALQFLEAAEPATPIRLRQHHKIMMSIKRLNGLMENVLLMRNLENTPMAGQARDFDGRRAMEAAYAYAVQPQEVQRVHMLCPEDAFLLHGHAKIFEYVVANLLQNALKYSSHQVTLQYEKNANASMASIMITDQGVGFSPEILSAIGKPFVRGEGTFTESGIGLGLYLVTQFAERSGGAVYICSDTDKETKVVLKWPYARQASEANQYKTGD